MSGIALTDADTYFAAGNHPMAPAWAKLTDDQKAEFFNLAKRMLSRAVGDDIDDQHDDDSETDDIPPRYDYAVHEQALFLAFKSGAAADGAEAGPKWLGYDGGESGGVLAPEALRWIGMGRAPAIELMRG